MSSRAEQNFLVPLSEEQRQSLGRVGVLFGGVSAEREISLKSGSEVLRALLSANINAIGLDVESDALNQIRESNLDRIFIVLHGVGGEDGRIQALLSYLNLPFTGSGHQASALAMDKLRSKNLWNGIGLSTPRFVSLDDGSDWESILQELGGQVMVKPSHEGSSIGMSKVSSVREFKTAFEMARKFDSEVLAEQLIQGREYSVAILGSKVLPPIELRTDNIFYDYNAKYVSDDTQYICPADLSETKTEELSALALEAFASLGCCGWGRVDIMADMDGNFYVLEVNTVPGMTDHSLVPMAAKAIGISFEQLVVEILTFHK